MRKVLVSFLWVLTVLSCSTKNTVESVAKKALVELGNGVYAGERFGSQYINLAILDLFKSPLFADYEIENLKAKIFIEKGQTQYDRDLSESFFATDILFKDIVFVKYEELYLEDVYQTGFVSHGHFDERELELLTASMEHHKGDPGFYSDGLDFCYIKYQDVPFYLVTYKLDNKYLADVTVARVKGEKPKVTSVYIR